MPFNCAKLSFVVAQPLGHEGLMPYVTEDGAWYEAHYRYERRGSEWRAILTRVEEIMPATPPQLRRFDDSTRLHMMAADGSLDFEAEAAVRRREWAEINAAS